MRKARHDRTAGFTLIEALMATALMGAILAALATITAQWLPNWNRGFARTQQLEHLALGIERVAADLAAAEFVSAGRDRLQPAFLGTELSVTFVRTALGPNTRPGLEIVRIAEAGGEQGPALVRTRARFVPIVPGLNDRMLPNFVDPVVLVRSPYRILFSYAGSDRVWRREWRDEMQLPRAIRIAVRDGATDRPLAVSTVAAVRAQLPVECLRVNAIDECLVQRPGPSDADPAQGRPREL